MKVFVTGGTGFIGSHTVKRLVKDGHHVTCLVRKTSDTRKLEELGVNLAHGDVTDRESVAQGMHGRDWVVHLAAAFSYWAPDNTIYHKVNVDGQRNVMEIALEQGVSRVVDVSTIGIWGNTPVKPITETTPFGQKRSSRYFETKYQGYLLTWELHQTRSLPLVSVFPVAVAGVGDRKGFRGTIQDLIAGYPGYAFPNAHLPTVHVQDVVEMIARVLYSSDLLGEKYIVGKYNPNLKEIFDMICDAACIPHLSKILPNSLILTTAYVSTQISNLTKRPPYLEYESIKLLTDDFVVDGSKAERDLGIVYTPIYQAFEEQIAEIRESTAVIQ
jgi:dihydroflavonol-4-reductase